MNAKHKVALVTGAATGIGRAVAIQLARQGYAIAVNYSKSKAEAQETLAAVKQLGVPAAICQCNVAIEPAVKEMMGRIQSELGGLDVLVNNAATTRFIPHADLDSLTEEVWDEILGVNLKGAYFCARAAIPLMQARGGGAIVNVTSVAGLNGSGSSMAYAASKAALNCLTKSMARAFGPTVRVNAVAPGPVLTRWLEGREEMIERYLVETPLRRASTPEDVAEVVCFLATSASMITGQVVVIDGGRST